MRLLIFFTWIFLTALPVLANPGGYVVGNSGDGILLKNGQTLWLTDLFEAGVVDHPVFSSGNFSRDPVFVKKVDTFTVSSGRSLALSPNEKDLLVEKLEDLQSLSPAFGDVVAAVLSEYEWLAVPDPLVPILNSEEILQLPEGATRVQVANRLDRTVRVNTAAWSKMAPEHRVALLVHESISALLQTRCTPDGLCSQSVRRAHALTGSLFSRDLTSFSQTKWRTLLADELSIDPGFSRGGLREPRWHLSLVNSESNRALGAWTLPIDFGALDELAVRDEICATDTAHPTDLLIYKDYAQIKLTFFDYNNADASAAPTKGLRAVLRNPASDLAAAKALSGIRIICRNEIQPLWNYIEQKQANFGSFRTPLYSVKGESREICENRVRRLGGTSLCAPGASCGSTCGKPGGSCASDEPSRWGACFYGADKAKLGGANEVREPSVTVVSAKLGQLIWNLYRTLLDRDPDAIGLFYWMNYYDIHDGGCGQLVRAFTEGARQEKGSPLPDLQMLCQDQGLL